MKRLTLDLDDETHSALKVLSAQEGVTMADLLRVCAQRLLDDDRFRSTTVRAAKA